MARRVFLNSSKFRRAKNECIKKVRKAGGIVKTVQRNTLKSTNIDTDEIHFHLVRDSGYLRGKKYPDLKQSDLPKYLENEFFDRNEADFNKDFPLLCKSFDQTIGDLIPKAVQESVLNAKIDGKPNAIGMHQWKAKIGTWIADLKRDKNGRIYVDVVFSNFSLSRYATPEEKKAGLGDLIEKPIPGTISQRFVLTDDGFKLEWFETSNALLEELCLSEDVDITDKKISQAEQEEKENLKTAITKATLQEAAILKKLKLIEKALIKELEPDHQKKIQPILNAFYALTTLKIEQTDDENDYIVIAMQALLTELQNLNNNTLLKKDKTKLKNANLNRFITEAAKLSSSTFGMYLSRDDVQTKLGKNYKEVIGPLLSQEKSSFTRLFDTLPKYDSLNLLDKSYQKITEENKDVWLDLAIILGLNDLFNSQGEVIHDVERALDGDQSYFKQIRRQIQSEQELKVNLLNAYVRDIAIGQRLNPEGIDEKAGLILTNIAKIVNDGVNRALTNKTEFYQSLLSKIKDPKFNNTTLKTQVIDTLLNATYADLQHRTKTTKDGTLKQCLEDLVNVIRLLLEKSPSLTAKVNYVDILVQTEKMIQSHSYASLKSYHELALAIIKDNKKLGQTMLHTLQIATDQAFESASKLDSVGEASREGMQLVLDEAKKIKAQVGMDNVKSIGVVIKLVHALEILPSFDGKSDFTIQPKHRPILGILSRKMVDMSSEDPGIIAFQKAYMKLRAISKTTKDRNLRMYLIGLLEHIDAVRDKKPTVNLVELTNVLNKTDALIRNPYDDNLLAYEAYAKLIKKTDTALSVYMQSVAYSGHYYMRQNPVTDEVALVFVGNAIRFPHKLAQRSLLTPYSKGWRNAKVVSAESNQDVIQLLHSPQFFIGGKTFAEIESLYKQDFPFEEEEISLEERDTKQLKEEELLDQNTLKLPDQKKDKRYTLELPDQKKDKRYTLELPDQKKDKEKKDDIPVTNESALAHALFQGDVRAYQANENKLNYVGNAIQSIKVMFSKACPDATHELISNLARDAYGNLYLDVLLYDIKSRKNPAQLSGTVSARFLLTDEGAKLEWIRPSNSEIKIFESINIMSTNAEQLEKDALNSLKNLPTASYDLKQIASNLLKSYNNAPDVIRPNLTTALSLARQLIEDPKNVTVAIALEEVINRESIKNTDLNEFKTSIHRLLALAEHARSNQPFSPFAAYLWQHETFRQNFLKPAEQLPVNVQSIPPHIKPLLDSFNDACVNKKEDEWLIFALGFVCQDLFYRNEKGEVKIRQDVYAMLNHPSTSEMDIKAYGEEDAKKQLMLKYLTNFIKPFASQVSVDNQNKFKGYISGLARQIKEERSIFKKINFDKPDKTFIKDVTKQFFKILSDTSVSAEILKTNMAEFYMRSLRAIPRNELKDVIEFSAKQIEAFTRLAGELCKSKKDQHVGLDMLQFVDQIVIKEAFNKFDITPPTIGGTIADKAKKREQAILLLHAIEKKQQMEKEFQEAEGAQYTKYYVGAVAWDFDGVLNDTYHPDSAILNQKGIATITDVRMITTVLQILEANKILSVLGSQRTTYGEYEDDSIYVDGMKNGLNEFGKDRNFLKLEHIEQIGQALKSKSNTTGSDKSIILDEIRKIKGCEFIPKKNIFLIDDHKHYQENIESHGYSFVHAPRSETKEIYEDRKHLAEILIRTIPAENLKVALENILDEKIRTPLIDAVNQCKKEIAPKLSVEEKIHAGLIGDGIANYNALPSTFRKSHLNVVSFLFDSARGKKRAKSYQELLNKVQSPFLKKMIVYAMLAAKDGPTLQREVYKAMGYSSLEEARNSLRQSIISDLQLKILKKESDGDKIIAVTEAQIQILDKAAKQIVKLANSKTEDLDKYKDSLNVLATLDPTPLKEVQNIQTLLVYSS